MTEALVHVGLGETRALVIDGDRVIEAHIERPGWRAGDVRAVQLTTILLPRVRAIVAVDLFGSPAPIAPLRTLGLPVLEDAAPAAGALQGGRRAGQAEPRRHAVLEDRQLQCAMTGFDPLQLRPMDRACDEDASSVAMRDVVTMPVAMAVAVAVAMRFAPPHLAQRRDRDPAAECDQGDARDR